MNTYSFILELFVRKNLHNFTKILKKLTLTFYWIEFLIRILHKNKINNFISLKSNINLIKHFYKNLESKCSKIII